MFRDDQLIKDGSISFVAYNRSGMGHRDVAWLPLVRERQTPVHVRRLYGLFPF